MAVDCVGSSADVLFESVAAEIIGAISLAKEGAIESPVSFVFFPVVVHAFDIVVSFIGILCVTEPGPTESDTMTTLQHRYSIKFLLALAGFGLSTRWLLFVSAAPGAWLHFPSTLVTCFLSYGTVRNAKAHDFRVIIYFQRTRYAINVNEFGL
ncbi:hypothetical protein B5M09_012554 [Aphanomyces astaci]|uniref:H(+)-exporting diphosphatase n=1 Tax=Aphanomyces astaci TaxID=112090 RepID=A0A3R7WE24_APHAT|nr:hypothetical protein B5M09_012554 [Aphanomyces astaci]